MDKHKKCSSKPTTFLKVKMINGSSIVTSLRQINTIAESKSIIALDRYTEVNLDTFKEIEPIAINPNYVVVATRINGNLIEGDK